MLEQQEPQEECRDEQVVILHGSKTPTAIQLCAELARQGLRVYTAWDGRLPTGGFAPPISTKPHYGKPGTRKGNLKKALCKLKPEEEDVGDEHVLQTVYEAEHRKRVVPDGAEKVELPQVLVVHVAGARDQPSELLASMEEGAMETRRSLRILRAAQPLVVDSEGALVYLLPWEVDSGCLRSAAHKSSRIVDQDPLRHHGGVCCTFALQCGSPGSPFARPEAEARRIAAWLRQLSDRGRWGCWSGRVASLAELGPVIT